MEEKGGESEELQGMAVAGATAVYTSHSPLSFVLERREGVCMYHLWKGTAYFTAHPLEMPVHDGTAQTARRAIDPHSVYPMAIRGASCSCDDITVCPSNRACTGNLTLFDLETYEMPRQADEFSAVSAIGKSGAIVPCGKFTGMMEACSVSGPVRPDNDTFHSVGTKLGVYPPIDSSYDKRIRQIRIQNRPAETNGFTAARAEVGAYR